MNTLLVECFDHEKVLNFVKFFSALIEIIVQFSFFGLLTRYIELFDFLILSHSYIPGI